MKIPLFWKICLLFWLGMLVVIQFGWIVPIHVGVVKLGVTVTDTSALDCLRAALADRDFSIPVQSDIKTTATKVCTQDAVMPDGSSVRLVFGLNGAPALRWTLNDILYMTTDYTIAALPAGFVVAAFLAWYLTRPIQRLRKGFGALADGDLKVRLQPEMGSGRDEISDLARDFDEMAEQLQTLVSIRDQLLHDVSHELRSPLARLNLTIALLRRQPANLENTIARMETEVRRLDTLVEELLSLARTESGSTSSDSYFDLGELVHAVSTDLAFEAQGKGVTVVTEIAAAGDLVLEGSPELLRRALENITRNSLRLSQPGQVVKIEISPPEAGDVEVSVTDEGPGAKPGNLQSMFEPFVRLDESMRGSGYGLGLAIARRAVLALKGTVEARNVEPHGLQVIIRLPVTPVQHLEE